MCLRLCWYPSMPLPLVDPLHCVFMAQWLHCALISYTRVLFSFLQCNSRIGGSNMQNHTPCQSWWCYHVSIGHTHLSKPATCKYFCSVCFFAPGQRVTKCSWMAFSCNFQLDITRQPDVRSMIHWLRWSLGMPLPLVGPLYYVCIPQWVHCASIL